MSAESKAPEGGRTADRLAEAMAELSAIADPCSISTGTEYKRRASKALEALKALRAAQPTAPNLACPSVQARLAAQWGYVPAREGEQP